MAELLTIMKVLQSKTWHDFNSRVINTLMSLLRLTPINYFVVNTRTCWRATSRTMEVEDYTLIVFDERLPTVLETITLLRQRS
jgi:hypothetical protein